MQFQYLKGSDVFGWARDLVTQLNRAFSTSDIPTGTVVAWPTDAAPLGWLSCDGAEYSKSQYPALFLLLSGVGDTFNVPNYNPPAFGQIAIIKS